MRATECPYRILRGIQICSGRCLVNRPIQQANVVGVLLQHLQVLAEKKYPDICIRAALTRQEVPGGLDRLGPAPDSQSLEKQRDHVDLAQRPITPTAGCTSLRRSILAGGFLMAAAVLEAPQRLRHSILQDFDVFGAKIGDELLVFVPRDDVEQNLLDGGM
jgi:hypothetical protein